MNVLLTNPISITIASAKLVVEDGNRGTIEFTLFDQPVRLNLSSPDYVYDITVAIGDRVRLIENYSFLSVNSKGIIQAITPDYTEDRVSVLFDEIYPDQVAKPVEAHVVTARTSLLVELPLRLIEKI
jgi:hypothetical protein